MDPLTAELLKRSAGLVANLLKSQARKTLSKVTLPRAIAKQAREEGIEVTTAAITRWIQRPDTQDQIHRGDSAGINTAHLYLTWLLSGSDEERERQAARILFIAYSKILEKAEPALAVALANEWDRGRARENTENIIRAVRESHDSIVGALNVKNDFFLSVAQLSRHRRLAAEVLRSTWPLVERVAHQVSAAPRPSDLMQQWATDNPQWLDEAPPEALVWLAGIAEDYAAHEASAIFYERALAQGVTYAPYWRVRHALCVAHFDEAAADAELRGRASEHPLARAFVAASEKRYQEAMAANDAWQADDAEMQSVKVHLQIQLLHHSGDLNGAIAAAIAAADDGDRAGLALLAAQLLLVRARHGATADKLADAGRAYDLAINARNIRRSWRGNSVEATLVAVKAAALCDNMATALRLLTAPPTGEAVDSELSDPAITGELARTFAVMDDFEAARQTLSSVHDEFIHQEVRAHEAHAMGDIDASEAAWRAALATASDDSDRLYCAMRIAELGRSLPDLGEVADRNPEVWLEVTAIHAACSAQGDPTVALRAHASESMAISVKLAERLLKIERKPESAAEVLRSAADRWDHPRLHLMAADVLLQAGSLSEARRSAEDALATGGNNWSGEIQARHLLMRIADQAGDHAAALVQCRRILAADPSSMDYRWTLTHLLVRRGDLAEAWANLVLEQGSARPRDRVEAKTWIRLASRFEASGRYVSVGLTILAEWLADEEVMGAFLTCAIIASARDGDSMAEDDVKALQEASQSYLKQFPDSRSFRQIIVDEADPLTSLADVVRQRHDGLSGVAEMAHNQQIPIGLVAEVSHEGYAETLSRKPLGRVRATHPGLYDKGILAALESFDKTVVVDASAACTLAVFDETAGELFRAAFGGLVCSDSMYIDGLRAVESVSMRGDMSLVWDPQTGRPVVQEVSPTETQAERRRAETILAVFEACGRRPIPQEDRFSSMSRDSGWTDSLSLAHAHSLLLWCDDALMREVATSEGVATFSTVELVRALVDAGKMGSDEAAIHEARLISEGYIEWVASPEVLTFAAELSGWRPEGVAVFLSRAAAWLDPQILVDLALRGLAYVVDSDYLAIGGWLTPVADSLATIAPNEQAAHDNLIILMDQCLASSWMRPDRFSPASRAIHLAVKKRGLQTDPVMDSLRKVHQKVRQEYGANAAANLLLGLVHYAPEQEQREVARMILLP